MRDYYRAVRGALNLSRDCNTPCCSARVTALIATMLLAELVAAQTAAPPAPTTPTERRRAQAPRMIEGMRIVPIQLNESGLMATLVRAGFPPVAESMRAEYERAMSPAWSAYRTCWSSTVDAPVGAFQAELLKTISEAGYPATHQSSQIPPLRMAANECDRVLITAACSAALGGLIPELDERLPAAIALRRADAAAASIATSFPGSSRPFIAVSAGLDALGAVSEANREAARKILLADAGARADVAERYAFEWLHGSIFLAPTTALEAQRASAAHSEEIDAMKVAGVAMAIQLRGSAHELARLATLDESIVTALRGALPAREAHTIANALEKSVPGSTGRQPLATDVAKCVASALSLPGVTAEQRAALDGVLDQWMREDLDRYTRELQTSARLHRALAERAMRLVASEPTTWSLADAGGAQQEQMTAAYGNLSERRRIADEAARRIEGIIGSEAWKSIAPTPMQGAGKPRASG